jgi:hypothetical protein
MSDEQLLLSRQMPVSQFNRSPATCIVWQAMAAALSLPYWSRAMVGRR